MVKYKVGDTAYIVESNRFITEGKIVSCTGGIYLFRYRNGGIRVKGNRLFASKEDAEKEIEKYRPKPKPWPYFNH